MVRLCDPDVVLFQEATDPAVFERLRAVTGMAEGASRKGHSLAFLSRLPVRHYEWHKPHRSRHPFLEVVVGKSDQDETRLFGLHLSAVHAAWTERRRVFELRSLLAAIARHQHGFHLVAGDFNTLAPGERLDVSKLPHRLRPFVWLSGGRIRWRTIQVILDGGYADGYRSQHPASPGYTFPTWDPQLRLDFAFVPTAHAGRLLRCEVITAPEAVEASDHFPLLAEIDAAPVAPLTSDERTAERV